MSEAQTVLTEEAPYGESVAKSETSSPTQDVAPAAAEPKAEPAEPKAETPEPTSEKEHPFTARTRQLNAKIASEARRADQAEARNADYERRLNPQPEPDPAPVKTQADYDRDVQTGAAKLAKENAFMADCNKIADAGNKEFADDFKPTLDSLWGVIGGVDAQGALTPSAVTLIEAAQEADNPAAILHHLGKNLDEAARIAALSPTRMGAAVVKLSASLAAKAVEAAAAAKAATKAPEPMESVTGGARASLSLGEMGMADYMTARNAQDKAARGR